VGALGSCTVGVLVNVREIRQFGADPPHDHLERLVGPICDTTTAVARRQYDTPLPRQSIDSTLPQAGPTPACSPIIEKPPRPLAAGVCPQVRATRAPARPKTWAIRTSDAERCSSMRTYTDLAEVTPTRSPSRFSSSCQPPSPRRLVIVPPVALHDAHESTWPLEADLMGPPRRC